MNRMHLGLAIILVTELVMAGLLVQRRLARVTPPVVDLSVVDPITAEEIAGIPPNDWTRLGEVALAYGYFPQAEAAYREAFARSPRDPDLAFKHGFALERLGEITQANERYHIAIGLGYPQPQDLWYYIGRNHLRLTDEPAAEDAFTRAETLPLARYELARIDARRQPGSEVPGAERLLREYPNAQQPASMLYREAVRRNALAEALRLGDRFFHQTGRLPNRFDTEWKWIEGIEANFGYRGLMDKAQKDRSAGRLDVAEGMLRKLQSAAWTAEANDQLGEIAFARRQPEQALQRFRETIDRAGPRLDRLELLADTERAAGQLTQARQTYERAEAFGTGPGLKNLRHKLATLYDQLGETSRAKSMHAKAFLSAAIELVEQGDPRSALPALGEALERDPDLAQAWFYRGEAYRLLNQPGPARTAYDECLKRAPDHGRARRGLALLSS